MKKILLFTAALAACWSAYAADDSTASSSSEEDAITVLMNSLEDIEVSAPRVQQQTATHEVIAKEELNRENTGQNLPYLLTRVPGLQVTSDDGLGVGYTYFRVRGTDHTRINMTVNDVPLNDSESQTVFWVNMTDMAASTSSIDVQRGVGTSTNGSASFGASLNMRTEQVDTTTHFSVAFNGGMYNTFREMVSAHIALPNHWQMSARVSKVNSDGFLYRATSDLLSYHSDLGYYGDKTQVVLSVFGGKEKTGMGWDGVDYNTAYGIDGADRRYNPAGEYTDAQGNTQYYDNQTDNYAQQHVQLHLQQKLSQAWSLSAALHYTHGGGYYEQYKNKKFSYFGLPSYTDANGEKVKKSFALYKKHLDNHFFGGIVSARFVSEIAEAQFGAAANHYIGHHFGQLCYVADSLYPTFVPVNYEYYRSLGHKTDANVYAKANWHLLNRGRHKLDLYTDLQYRYINYQTDGINDEDLMYLYLNRNFHFFNPKVGLSYVNRGHLLYANFAIANREPSRANFTENIQYDPATGEYTGDMPEAERLYDYEVGYTYSHPRFSVGANLYMMDYDNQLVLTGRVNDVGAQSTTNVKDSYRMGIELTAGVKITDWFRFDGNLVLSRNRILNYTDVITRYDSQTWDWVGEEEINLPSTAIAFAPSITAMTLFTFDYKGFLAEIQTNVTGRQYLDNTMNESAMLRAYTTTNLNLQYQLPMDAWCNGKRVPQIRLLAQLNNVFNAKYASNGGSDLSYFEDNTNCWPWFYAQAGINVHAGVVVDF